MCKSFFFYCTVVYDVSIQYKCAIWSVQYLIGPMHLFFIPTLNVAFTSLLAPPFENKLIGNRFVFPGHFFASLSDAWPLDSIYPVKMNHWAIHQLNTRYIQSDILPLNIDEFINNAHVHNDMWMKQNLGWCVVLSHQAGGTAPPPALCRP